MIDDGIDDGIDFLACDWQWSSTTEELQEWNDGGVWSDRFERNETLS